MACAPLKVKHAYYDIYPKSDVAITPFQNNLYLHIDSEAQKTSINILQLSTICSIFEFKVIDIELVITNQKSSLTID